MTKADMEFQAIVHLAILAGIGMYQVPAPGGIWPEQIVKLCKEIHLPRDIKVQVPLGTREIGWYCPESWAGREVYGCVGLFAPTTLLAAERIKYLRQWPAARRGV